MEEANKLIGQGKKHLVMGKVVEAVNTLQEACGIVAKKYGDTADECGEAFFWCGKALLDLARMENSVLGNALQGVPEEEEEEKLQDSNVEMESTESLDEKTRDELRVQVYDAMAEKEETKGADDKKDESTTEKADDAKDKTDNTSEMTKDCATEKENETSEGKEPTTAEKSNSPSAATEEKANENKSSSPIKDNLSKEKDETEEMPTESDEHKVNVAAETDKENDAAEAENEEAEEANADEEMEGDEEAEETEGDEKADGEDTAEKGSDDEEVGNLQLAWEMLEVAKKRDQRGSAHGFPDSSKTREVSAESGNYTQAIEDFHECLKLQLKHLESDSRLLAETYYQLGLTYSLNCQYKQAIDELNSSISVIKSRLEKLQELLNKAEGPDALPEERKEMEDLKALLPEIQEKIEDATEGLKTATTDAEAVKGVLDGNATPETGDKLTSTKANGTPSEQTTATDISHLVRKKRKPEESPVNEVKKMKQDETQTNGAEEPNEVHTNGHSNGQ